MERNRYEFSRQTKRKARKKAGLPHGHVHHRKIPVWVAQKHDIPPYIVSREDNAQAVDIRTHRLIHKYETEEDYLENVRDALIEVRGDEVEWGSLEEDETSWW